MNYSRQRELILNILSASRKHPTAEEILTEVRREDQKVARGTVYRNLGLLVENGDIIKIATSDGVCRYDYIHKPHSHAVCSKCGRVIDFVCHKNAQIADQLLSELGFKADGCEFFAFGVCSDCSDKT